MPRRKCKGCDQYTIPKDADKRLRVCSEACRDKVIVEVIAKERAKREAHRKRLEKLDKQKFNKRKRAFYDKDIKTRREAAVYWFNRFIRLRDAGSGCISCGTGNPDLQYHAGHFVPAGSCSALRFDERNCHLQCARCNLFLSGNLAEYRIRLDHKIGSDDLAVLEGPQPTIKITADWYRGIEQEYKAKCKLLEAADCHSGEKA